MAEKDARHNNNNAAVIKMENTSERVKVICLGDSAVGKSKYESLYPSVG